MTPDQLLSFQFGLNLFNTDRFYDCHEVLEELWNDLHGHEKKIVQGVLQVAVGFYHLRTGNLNGSRNLFRKSLHIFESYPTPTDFPLSIVALRENISALHASLLRIDTLSPDMIISTAPTLKLMLNPNISG